MRDSEGAEFRMSHQPNHFAVSTELTASWVPQTFYKKVKAPPPLEENPSAIWSEHWQAVKFALTTSLQQGNVDKAWSCWNGAAVAALGFQPGDRGTLKVKWTHSKSDPEVIQDLQRRHGHDRLSTCNFAFCRQHLV
eukprot:6016068-Amphidinium_carterae.2